jgi:diguanylate cyclase (GGDEF)-like protein/PAS domain S-box-containing protein
MTLFRTIRAKISLAFSLVAVIMMAFAAETAQQQFAAAHRATLLEARDLAQSIAYSSSVIAALDRPSLQAYVRGLHELYHRDIVIMDVHKNVLADAEPDEIGQHFDHDLGHEVDQVMADGQPRTFVETSDAYPGGARQLAVALRSNQSRTDSRVIGAVIVEYTDVENALLSQARADMARNLAIALGCLVAAGFIGLRTSSTIVRPLAQLAAGADRIAAGQYDVSFTHRSNDEVGLLSAAFEHMASRLAQNAREIQAYQQAFEEQSARDLQESEQRYRQLVELSPDAICIEQRGRVVFANPACAQLLGERSAAQLLGRGIHRYLTADARAVWGRLRDDVAARRQPTGLFQTTLRRPDGTVIDVEGVAGPFEQGGRICTQLVLREITERKRASERLEYMAQYDSLTGLPNRVLFKDRLNQAMARARRHEATVALMFLDLDHFKAINDSLGHSAGDAVLQAVAQRFATVLRDVDTLARLGGDEFTIILDDARGVEDVSAVAERLLQSLQPPVVVEGREVYTGTSIGIAVFPGNGNTTEELTRAADIAMYKAKEDGRGTFAYFDAAMAREAAERHALTGLLRRALDAGELSLHYQPKVSLASGRVVGVEALLRWHSRELGAVPPCRFIPMAEESGVIVPIGAWVLETACRQAMQWQAQGLPALPVSVNLSARQLQQRELVGTVDRALQSSGLPPRLLDLEITETMLMQDPDRTVHLLAQLRALGVQLSIDDFGTGYSSLAYLKKFPVQTLKIDRSFVQDLAHDPDDASIVSAVVALARKLHLQVIAEGVETPQQLDFLAQLGCDQYQGYLFSRPVPADELARLLQALHGQAGAAEKQTAGA